MRPEKQRDMSTQALVMGAIFCLVMVLWGGMPLGEAAFVSVFFAGMMYLSYWMTNKVFSRWRPKPRGPEPAVPLVSTTDRPEHAQRRRERARRRDRRRAQ